MPDKDGLLYRFDFMSGRSEIKMHYHVIGHSYEDVIEFLRQHSFDLHEAVYAIKAYDSSEVKDFDTNFLKPVTFKSNCNDKTYTILTTQYILDRLSENLASDLANTLLFGEAIFRRDIEIFKLIGDLVMDLPHVHLLDFTRADIESTDNPAIESVKEIMALSRQYGTRIGAPTEDSDILEIMDSFERYELNEPISPYTIEGYIANFTEMMIDVYD